VTERLPNHIFLFYGNRRPEDAASLDEMRALAMKDANLTFIPTMSEMEKSRLPWDGERGLIDTALLKKYAAAVRSAIYYITSPPGMVKACERSSRTPAYMTTTSELKSSPATEGSFGADRHARCERRNCPPG